jgi:hypothetical protein
MLDTTFDSITALLVTRISRRGGLRAILGATLTGFLSLPGRLDVDAKKHKRRGKKKNPHPVVPPSPAVPPSPPSGGACPLDQKIDGVCCPAAQIFVKCPDVCLCAANPDFCCATSSQRPAMCPTSADIAPALCCPLANVCGDVCCDPSKESCDAGQCQCQARNQCGPFCCDPRFFACNVAEQSCDCILPDPLDCPAGTGGFHQVRRLP